MGAIAIRRARLRRRGQCHSAAGDVLFRHLGAARQLLDGMAVAVARREVHSRVSARRILAKNLLDLADTLEEDRPVDRRQQPHRRDDVADGELTGGLALMLDAEHLFGGIVLRFECALQGMPRRRGRGRLIAEPVEQFDDEGGREPAARCRFVAQHLVDDVFRLAVAGRELHAPRARAVAAAARRDHFSGQSPQLFDQPEPQHDRDRPDLSDGQRRRALIRGGEVDERLEIETAGRVCDQFARERVDAWISGERTVRELWQLEIVPVAEGPGEFRGPGPERCDGCRAASLPSRLQARPW